jgi:ketosteroid isomerase-like protein
VVLGFDVDHWIEALRSGDIEALRALATDDMVVETLGTSSFTAPRTFEQFSENLQVLLDLASGTLEFRITDLLAGEDRIGVEFAGRAELPDGSRFDELHFTVLYLRNGKVWRIRKYSESELSESVFGQLARRRR